MRAYAHVLQRFYNWFSADQGQIGFDESRHYRVGGNTQAPPWIPTFAGMTVVLTA
jgi:hypothetical protein